MNPLVSVIIPTKNSARTLAACLQSIHRQSYPSIEILVIDNSSTDATKQIATAGHARYIASGYERSTQRNAGARISNGEYIVFIDSDMELHKSVVQDCMKIMQNSEHIKAIVIPEKSFGEGFWAQCKQFERSLYNDIVWMQAARSFRKSAYVKINGFDETLIGLEDFDIHNRIITTFGEQSVEYTSSVIYHNDGHVSLRRLLAKKLYYGKSIPVYRKKVENQNAYSKQANIIARIAMICRITNNDVPILVRVGTIWMIIAEFVAGGLGYALNMGYTALHHGNKK